MSLGGGREEAENMSDRQFSHPLTAALATLIGTAGIQFQWCPFPLHTHTYRYTHTHTTCHKDKEGKGGDVKKRVMVPLVIPWVRKKSIIDF